MTRYLSLQQVIEVNMEVTHRFGGVHGIRDSGALDAAVARPQTGYYRDVIEEAAALFESLSQNHLPGWKQANRDHLRGRFLGNEWVRAFFRRCGDLRVAH